MFLTGHSVVDLEFEVIGNSKRDFEDGLGR